MIRTACKAARIAGKVMNKYYGNFGKLSYKKSKKSILTQVDLKVEKEIINTIREKYPDHSFISEETGTKKTKSDYTWIIDPIDGTTNYIQKLPGFCASIGLASKQELILGVIYDPILKELYLAEKGKGAFLNTKRLTVSKKKEFPVSVLAYTTPSRSSISITSFQKISELYPYFRGIRNTGSAALNLCYVASRRYDIYFTKRINVWDVAAGILILREAGGKVTDFHKNEWELKTSEMVSSNGNLHDKFLRLLKRT